MQTPTEQAATPPAASGRTRRRPARAGWPLATLVVVAAAGLAGCASRPPSGGPGSASVPWPSSSRPDRDGPEANPPPNLAATPDAEPRIEPIRSGGPNKPYEALGQTYVPQTDDRSYTQLGLASWYGRKFHGRRTASGEPYDMYAMSAAHPTLPIPSYARVRNPANGREIIVRINDRGPFHSNRIIDLSYTAALKLDLLRGVAPVEVSRLTSEEIRTGAWRRGTPGEPEAAATAVAAAATGSRRAARQPAPVVAAAAPVAPAPAPAPAPTPPAEAASPTPAVVPTVGGNTGPAAVAAAAPPPSTEPGSPAGGVAAAAVVAEPPPAPTTVATSPAPAAPDAPVSGVAAARSAATGFFVQLGAFRQREGADGFHRRVVADLDWLAPLLAVFNDTRMFRLQAGPYPSRDEALNVARRVRDALQLVPMVVERR